MTGQSAYVATATKSHGVKIDGLCTKKSPFTPQKVIFFSSWGGGGLKVDFLVQGSDGGGTFSLLFWNLHKIWT